MEVGQLCSILEACMSQNPQQRGAAEETLKQFQYTRGQLVNLLRIVVEPSLKQEIRQFASIVFKNLVKSSWIPEDGQSPLHEEDMAAVRDNLLEGIIRSPPVIRNQFAECLRALVYADYPEKWPGLLDQIVGILNTKDESRLHGCLLALRILTRKFEFRSGAERETIDTITRAAFPPLLEIIEHLVSSNANSPEVGELLKLGLKVFWSSIYMDVPAIVLEHFSRWMTVLHLLISRPVPQEGQPEDLDDRKNWIWWKVQKWALNIAFHSFNRRGSEKPKKAVPGDREQKFGELWREGCSLQFLEDMMALASRIVMGEYMSPRVVNLVLKYLGQGIVVDQTWKVMKPHVQTLITGFVFPHMCFSNEDAELWEEDPQEYIRKGYDMIEDMYSPKSAATQVVSSWLTVRPKANVEFFMQFIVQIMMEYQATSSPTAQQARRLDGAFLAIGSLVDLLKRKKAYRRQLESMLLQHVMPAFSSPYGHLRAKACWLCGQFADIEFREGCGQGSTFHALFTSDVKALRDPDLPVRVDAVAGLRQLVDAYDEDHLDEMKPHLPVLLDQLFSLMTEVENEDLVFTLESIVEKFGEDMAPYALGLCQHLTQAFWRLQSSEAKDDQDEDEQSLAAFGCLRALSTVLESVSSLPEIFPTLEPIVLPVLQKMCGQEGQDVYEEIMEILSYFTYFSPQISPQMWELWPLLHQAYNEWAADYFENILVPLDNFITRGTETFLSTQNPNYLQQAIQMADKSISDPDASEGDVVPAPKLLEIILQACRGRVDQYVPHIIGLALTRLQTAKRLNLRVQLVNVIANAIYYNPNLALQTLHQQGSLATFLPLWFQMIFEQRPDGRRKFFRRQHDKKVGVLSLTALLTAPDGALPAELQAGMAQVTLACIKLLLDLKKQQDDYKEAEEDDGEEESDDDDVVDDEEEEQDEGNEAEDEAYMQRLSREAAKLAGTSKDSDSDDEWTDDEEEATPIDHVNPYISFTEALSAIEGSQPARLQVCLAGLGAESHTALQTIAGIAQQQHKEALEKKK